MKRSVALLLMLIMVISVIPFAALPVSADRWSIYTYKITSGKAEILRCDENASGAIVIPDKLGGAQVVRIGDEAFYDCDKITSVTMPNTIESIGNKAFLYCDSLATVKFGTSLKTVGEFAFYHCDELASVNLPDSIVEVGESSFASCYKLKSIKMGSGLKVIGDRAFEYSYSLSSINIPDNVTDIGEGAFTYCYQMTSLTLGSSVKNINKSAFYRCSSLKSVNIPASVRTIGDYAFYECSALKDLVIQNGVKTIGESAFENCRNLTAVKLPNSVTSIERDAFENCTSLRNATIGTGITYIPYCAFYGCSNLRSVTIPKSVTSISYYAFSDCPEIWDVYYTASSSRWQAIDIGSDNEQLVNANIHFNSTLVPFYDVALGDWYADAATYCSSKGYISGVSDGIFSPDSPLTRAQFVQILAKVEGVDLSRVVYKNKFTDVPGDAWFSKAVTWAVDFGVTGGVGNNMFAPNTNVTRAQLAVFLRTYAEKKGKDVTPKATITGYADYSAVPSWARVALAWAVGAKLISGTDATHLSPNNVATRAQAALIIKNYCETIK